TTASRVFTCNSLDSIGCKHTKKRPVTLDLMNDNINKNILETSTNVEMEDRDKSSLELDKQVDGLGKTVTMWTTALQILTITTTSILSGTTVNVKDYSCLVQVTL
ncbi:unnamed protein product, partial [Meganyctiphanes norvegica]